MSLGKVFELFVEQRPICVMARGVLEHLFNAARIDELCARTAEMQYTRALLFSSVVDLMGQVVLGVQPSVHAAYQAQADQLGVSDQAVYDKLNHVELRVSAELVRDAARQAAPVIGALQAELPPLVPGYRTKILDGNHLAASDHRLEALRHTPTVSPLMIPLVYCHIKSFQRASRVEKPWPGGAKRRDGWASHPVAW